MKASGIIRRVDSLGRIVIPKELRQSIGIHTGDSLEVGLNADNQIVLSRHSWLKELERPAKELCRTLQRVCGCAAAVTDRERVLAAAGFGDCKLTKEPISVALRRITEGNTIYRMGEGAKVFLTERHRDMVVTQAVPISIHGEASGCVLLAVPANSAKSIDPVQMECDLKIITTLSSVIGSYLSN